MATVFLNGRFVNASEATVSAFDAGLQHGVGLFETMLAVRGADGARIIHLEEHMARLERSSGELALTSVLHTDALARAVQSCAERGFEEAQGVERLRIRLTLTGGDLNLLERARAGEGGGGGGGTQTPTLLITAQPAAEYPRDMFERGVSAVIADARINPLDPHAGHKTLNYWPRLRALQAAAAARAGEALFFQVTNHLAGGAVSNIFLVKDGALLTPIARGEETEVARGNAQSPGGVTLPSPVLPGVTRGWVLELAPALGHGPERRMLTINDLHDADEVFLTNSGWGVLPVVKVELHDVGDGTPGPVTRSLVEAWRELIRAE